MNRLASNGARGRVLLSFVCAVALAVPAGASGAVTQRPGGAVHELVSEQFVNCPTDSAFEGGPLRFCIDLKAYEGDLRLGNVDATIDEPLEMFIAIGGPLNDLQVVLVGADGEGGGTSAADEGNGSPAQVDPVKISGGILGIPGLDPIIDSEPLGLMALSATPTIGDGLDFEVAQFGPEHISRITLPLSIKLNNTLFGEDCEIPEFEIHLTTGSTEPPAGVEPMVGTPPEERGFEWLNYPPAVLNPGFGSGTAHRLVDNTFDVPAARNCDLLPREVHDGLDGPARGVDDMLADLAGSSAGLSNLIGRDGGLFDPLINSQVGLPSPAGRNHMAISVDTTWVGRGTVAVLQQGIEPLWTTAPGLVDFGSIVVGESSAVETVLMENHSSAPRSVPSTQPTFFGGQADQFEIVSDGCAGQTLNQGDSCPISVRFTPTTPGVKLSSYWHPSPSPFLKPAPTFAVEGEGRIEP